MGVELMLTPRRILMTADAVGGVWSYALELARALGRHDVRVAIATMGAAMTPAQREEARAVPNVDLHESTFKLEWMDDPWDDVGRAGDWLLGLAEEVQADLIHLNGYAHAALAWGRPTLVVGHSCVLSWWEAVKGEPAPPSWGRYRAEVARGLRNASMVAAPSAAMLAALGRHYGALAPARVIPNGREASAYMPDVKSDLVLAAGRLWDEAKNIAALGRVAPRLPWPVCVAGEDVDPRGDRSRFGSIRLLGRLAPRDLARRYARASIFAMPARYEPFGLSALEAGLAGCALVLGDIPSLREVWGDAALYVPPDDTESLESTLRALIEDGTLRSTLAARARARALTFTPQRMAEGYLTAYRELREINRQDAKDAKERERGESESKITSRFYPTIY